MPYVVVLEDERDIRTLLCDALDSQGYQVVCPPHPAQLDDYLLDCDPDLFLIDLMLPRTSGIEVVQKLQTGPFADVPRIAMSASVLMAQLAEHSGLFQETIRKPFDLDELFSVIDRCLAARDGAVNSESGVSQRDGAGQSRLVSRPVQ